VVEKCLVTIPATLELAVVAAGPRGVPTRPEVRLFGITEKHEDGQKKEMLACGLGSGKIIFRGAPSR